MQAVEVVKADLVVAREDLSGVAARKGRMARELKKDMEAGGTWGWYG